MLAAPLLGQRVGQTIDRVSDWFRQSNRRSNGDVSHNRGRDRALLRQAQPETRLLQSGAERLCLVVSAGRSQLRIRCFWNASAILRLR